MSSLDTAEPLDRDSPRGGSETDDRARFEDLVDGLDAIVWEMNVQTWTFTYVSRRAEEILGYPVEQWLAEPSFWSERILHPEDREWALDLCTSATRDARDHEFEYRAIASDGRVVWLRDLVRVVRNDRGEPALLRGVMIDISEQKSAEAQLRGRERHNALSAEIAEIVTRSDLPEILGRASEAMVRHLGAGRSAIWTLLPSEQLLELQASAGSVADGLSPGNRVAVDASPIGRVVASGAPLVGDREPIRSDHAGEAGEAKALGQALYPLLMDGRVTGVIELLGDARQLERADTSIRSIAERLAFAIERERTARELRRRERQLAEAQQIAHLGSWEWNVGEDSVIWSEELHRIFGVARGTPITFDSYLERILPEDRELVTSTVRQAIESGEGYQFEHRVRRPDGTVRTIYSQAAVETDDRGRPVRLFGVAQDVTERKEAADRAQQLALERVARAEAEAVQRKITGILESITDAFFALDSGWRFTYVNAEAEKLLQRPAAEILGRVVWEEFPAAVGSTFETMYRRAVEERRTVQFREYYPPLESWFEVRAFPADGGLSVYFRDISEQKQAEEALQYQSYITRTITDNATAALFMMDEHGRCTYMNPAAEAMTGYSLDEIGDMALHDAIHHRHPDGTPYPMADCPIDRALPEDFSIRAHEDVFIRKNGEFFPVVCAASPIFREGLPVGTVVEVRDVSAEREAERAVRESEERFRSLVEATAAIVWRTAATGDLEGDQPQWSAFTGQPFEVYQGAGWLEAIHPDDRARTASAWRHAVENRTLYEVEHRLRRHDGEYRHMMARATPIVELDGTLREWVGIHTDVTARRLMEERQRFLADVGGILASSLDYKTTLRSVARLAVPMLADWCAIDLIGEDGELDRVEVAHSDPRKREIAIELNRRYPPDPALEMGVPHVLRTRQPELVPEIPDELIGQAAHDPEHLAMLRELGLKSYMIVPLMVRGRTLGAITLVSAESGRRYGGHDLRTAEELAIRAAFAVDNAKLFRELDVALEQIASERARLQELFVQAPAVIALYSGADHVVTVVNAMWEQVLRKTDAVGKPFRDVFPELEDSGLFELLDRVYESGEPFVAREMQLLLDRGDDVLEESYWNFVLQPITGIEAGGRDIFVHAVEVTDQVRARQQIEARAEELRRLAGALERSNRELDQFAYVTSHDLKAPLRGIANLSQWIEEDLGDEVPEETREHLQLLRGRVLRMEGLIDGILQYSRAGRVRDEAQQVDAGELLADVIDMLSPPDHVTIRVQGKMPSLTTERLPLQQVFMNLIGNAIKYNEAPDATVEIGCTERGDSHFEFSVRDNGPGIAPDYHERIFAIFQTLHARDHVEGTGIGLSLVRKIVETRGGQVWVESEEGAGATFRFLWPKRPEVSTEP